MSKKITTEDFVRSMQQINPSIVILGEYVAAKKPIHCRCAICGYEWDPTPGNLKQGRGCQKCSGHYHRTQEEFVSEVAKNNPSIEILGEFVSMSEPIDVRCKICGKRWSPIAQSVFTGYACKACASKKISEKLRMSADEVYQRMHEAHPEIEILGTYVDADTPVKCRCSVCGYEWERTGKQLQAATGCPQCLHQLPLTQEEFVSRVNHISPSIEIIGKYTRRKDSVKCKCKTCGYEWDAKADNLLLGNGCNECAKRKRDERLIEQRKPHSQFVKELEEVNPHIEVLGTYVNSTTEIKVKCKHCGMEWDALPPKLLAGSGCSECSPSSTSFMERMICEAFRERLGEESVISRNKNIMGFEMDVYIPSLSLAIEPGSWFWHKAKVENDRYKREACAKKGIRMISIYDCYPDSVSPFPADCYTFSIDLGQEKGHQTLKMVITKLFTLCGIACDFSHKEWKGIEHRAYISSRKMSSFEFRQRIESLNPEIEVLGDYHSVGEPIRCRCKKCGFEWEPFASDLLYNASGCRKCAGKMKLSQDEFVERLAEKNPTIEVIGEYVNSQTRLEVKCKICGRQWPAKPNNLLQGMGCRKCSSLRLSKTRRKTNEQFLMDFGKKGNLYVELLGAYTGAHTKIPCRCKICGYEWEADPSSLLQGHGCKKCADERKKVNENREPRYSNLE